MVPGSRAADARRYAAEAITPATPCEAHTESLQRVNMAPHDCGTGAIRANSDMDRCDWSKDDTTSLSPLSVLFLCPSRPILLSVRHMSSCVVIARATASMSGKESDPALLINRFLLTVVNWSAIALDCLPPNVT